MFKRGDTSTVKLAIGLAIVAAVILMFLPFIKNLTNLAGDKQTSQAQATLDHFSTEIQNLVDASYNYQEIALRIPWGAFVVGFDSSARSYKYYKFEDAGLTQTQDIFKPQVCGANACLCLYERDDVYHFENDEDLFGCVPISSGQPIAIVGANDNSYFNIGKYSDYCYNVGNELPIVQGSAMLFESLVLPGTDTLTNFRPQKSSPHFEFKTRYLSMRKFESEGKLYVIVADSAFADMMRRIK